jgi:hypothetical protein
MDREENMSKSEHEFHEAAAEAQPVPAAGPPEVSMQQLIDAGLNAFALQLFAESVAGKDGAKTFTPFSFIFRNIKITLEPNGEVDTSHH